LLDEILELSAKAGFLEIVIGENPVVVRVTLIETFFERFE